jgi:Flavodoxin reductases (ferredoxin-NADPH reductases) family 1
MKRNIVKVESVGMVTHDVVRIVTAKPDGFIFEPGQAVDISINKAGWMDEKRPFTFTCLPDDPYLEFTIKIYPSRHGVTKQLLLLRKGDELILNDVFGTIAYKNEGVFIAGGAGITPFISIFRYLKSKDMLGRNMLVFANKAKADIILEREFSDMLGDRFVNILSEEVVEGYHHGLINEEFLKEIVPDFNLPFYLCGPPPMMDALILQLAHLGVSEDLIVKEEM